MNNCTENCMYFWNHMIFIVYWLSYTDLLYTDIYASLFMTVGCALSVYVGWVSFVCSCLFRMFCLFMSCGYVLSVICMLSMFCMLYVCWVCSVCLWRLGIFCLFMSVRYVAWAWFCLLGIFCLFMSVKYVLSTYVS